MAFSPCLRKSRKSAQMTSSLSLLREPRSRPVGSRDFTGCVLMPPLPPEDALPHVEDAAMLQAMALIEPKQAAVDRGGQTGPVRCRHKARYGTHLRIEYPRQESRRC